ncbi:MAG: hypothetical protein N2651_07425 [Fimbriimonadales bacterium]|nr:hypothetical protein [Fimbriimonadales bacterium]
MLGLLWGCQSRPQLRVRVDVERAAQSIALPTGTSASLSNLPAQQLASPPDSAQLEQLESPPPAETLKGRRELALKSIEQQREAVRERLLQVRLQSLPELEQRWHAELRAQYDFDALRDERDAQWQEAFQQYGRQRFPLLVALIFTVPDSEARRQTQTQLEAIDRAWQTQQESIEMQYQARQQRIEQEITVRVNARKRAFIREAEAEVLAQLTQQPDATELYLPQPRSLPPAPPRKETLYPASATLPARELNAPLRERREQTERLRRRILEQLAQEWAQVQGYQLTDDPHAPDKTEAFVRYLLAR